jgi:transcriptional regulator with XRE-family HTH domain
MTASPEEGLLKVNIFLRAWRKSRKLTLEALAEQIGSKVSTISGWETGRRAVDLEDLAKLAAAYGVHPAALLFDPGEAVGKISKMQTASALVEQMPPDAADEWLAMGKRLTER